MGRSSIAQHDGKVCEIGKLVCPGFAKDWLSPKTTTAPYTNKYKKCSIVHMPVNVISDNFVPNKLLASFEFPVGFEPNLIE